MFVAPMVGSVEPRGWRVRVAGAKSYRDRHVD